MVQTESHSNKCFISCSVEVYFFINSHLCFYYIQQQLVYKLILIPVFIAVQNSLKIYFIQATDAVSFCHFSAGTANF
jgi:hypothetical protein